MCIIYPSPSFPTLLWLNPSKFSIRIGLPKKVERFFFFNIVNKADFQLHLEALAPHITTASKAAADLRMIGEAQTKDSESTPPKHTHLEIFGINIAFSFEGLKAVS
jgi:hypothetical protein